jgi:hypothetical protein
MSYDAVSKLTKELILQKISEEQIFEQYLGITPDLNKTYTNPLRKDHDPGCRFYYSSQTNKLRFRDYAEGWDGDCFDVVIRRFGCIYPKALEIVATEFSLYGYGNRKSNSNNTTNTNRSDSRNLLSSLDQRKTTIKVNKKPWNHEDAKYWKTQGFNSQFLDECKVYSVFKAWINYNDGRGDLDLYIYRPGDPCYAYLFPDKTIKLYFPFRKSSRFITNSSYLQGYNLLPDKGDHLVITKSYKDVIAMKMFGINAVAPQAESSIPKGEQMLELSNRFDTIFSLYDWDRAGIRGTRRMLNEYPYINPLFFTKKGLVKIKYDFTVKDFTENLTKYGIQDTIDIINYVRTYYSR